MAKGQRRSGKGVQILVGRAFEVGGLDEHGSSPSMYVRPAKPSRAEQQGWWWLVVGSNKEVDY